jgi:hypothetical protein
VVWVDVVGPRPEVLGCSSLRRRPLILLLGGDLLPPRASRSFLGARGLSVGFQFARFRGVARFSRFLTPIVSATFGTLSNDHNTSRDKQRSDGEYGNDGEHVPNVPVVAPDETGWHPASDCPSDSERSARRRRDVDGGGRSRAFGVRSGRAILQQSGTAPRPETKGFEMDIGVPNIVDSNQGLVR